MYVTPERYRTMGQGVDLDALDDGELAAILRIASSMADTFCAVPAGHDFRGGTIVDERHIWDIGNTYRRGSGRIYPFHRPVRDLSAFRIQVTNNQYLDVTNSNVYVHPELGYVEPVVAAASIGVWSYSAVPIAGLQDPVAKISYTYGWQIPVVDELVYPDGTTTIRAANQAWTTDAVTVKVNGATVSPTSIDRTEGAAVLATAPVFTDVVMVSYTHKLPPPIRDATAIIATSLVGGRGIAESGLLGLHSIRFEEVELVAERNPRRHDIPDQAALMLRPYVYHSIA